MHRLLMNCPNELEVDHVNRNKLDNRKANLRIVTRQQNTFNKGSYLDSSSRYKGVSWHRRDQLWFSQLRLNNKNHYLGSYETEEIAAAAYNHYAKVYFGEYAVLNDVDAVDFKELRILKKKGMSKYRGVTYHKRSDKWIARITIDGRRISLGYFHNEVLAAKAYNEAFIKYRNGKEAPNAI
ncbi:AP2 domain-containing protein [Sporomusa ovata]|nr:AP2 domain-containing protein [Sporomusa ovata]